jgi:NTE family protein
MVVNSYPARCNYEMPTWVPNARQDEAVNPDRTRSAIELESYVDTKRTFLHLMDGGIVDNIGLRGPLHALTSTDTFVKSDGIHTGFTIQGDLNSPPKIKKLLFIVVTAEPDSRSVSIDSRQQVPGIIKVLSNVINTPMGNVSFDTIGQLFQTLQSKNTQQRDPVLCQQLARSQQCPNFTIPGGDQEQIGYFMTVASFPLVSDRDLRNRLNSIGTNFSLKPGQLDDLVAGASDVIRNSDDYKKFVTSLGGTPPTP